MIQLTPVFAGRGSPDAQVITEVQALEESDQRVVAIRLPGADPQGQVDLAGRPDPQGRRDATGGDRARGQGEFGHLLSPTGKPSRQRTAAPA